MWSGHLCLRSLTPLGHESIGTYMCLDILSWSVDTLSDMSHCGTYESALTESFVTLDMICVWTFLSWSVDTLSDMSHCGTYECALTESFVTLDIICVWTSCPEPFTHIMTWVIVGHNKCTLTKSFGVQHVCLLVYIFQYHTRVILLFGNN